MVTVDIHFILFLINGETHLRSNQGQERETKIEENTTFVVASIFEKKRIVILPTVLYELLILKLKTVTE